MQSEGVSRYLPVHMTRELERRISEVVSQTKNARQDISG